MNITKGIVKAALLKKGHKWFDDVPILVGIRSALNAPNVFNDILCLFTPDGIEKYYPITTDPGTTYLLKPINAKGCFVLKEDQYLNVWAIGFHQGKPDHKALRQVGSFTGYRDNDLDRIAETIGKEDTGVGFGINCHGANKKGITVNVNGWSAGCQVHASWANKEEMIAILETYRDKTNNRFHYTLINEKNL